MTSKRMKGEDTGLVAILSDDIIDDTPLVQVYIDTIKDHKTTSKIIQDLNKILPLPDLIHLKRVRTREIILCPVDHTTDPGKLLEDSGFNHKDLLAGQFRKIEVARSAPKTRRQYDKVKQLWPCNFHPDPYLEKLVNNRVFDGETMKKHRLYMGIAVEIAKRAESSKRSAALIVDPKTDSIVGLGYDRSTFYPYEHAIMVAVESVARGQRGLEPVSDEWRTFLSGIYKELKYDGVECRDKEDVGDDEGGSYLCTGYYVYSTHEPCVGCAMAMIHSRVKRVFYGAKRRQGGLGSSCKVHVIENLNHHYEVFAGLLEDECEALSSLNTV